MNLSDIILDNNKLKQEIIDSTRENERNRCLSIKIQSTYRGYCIRKYLSLIEDGMSYEIMMNELERYNNNLVQVRDLNTRLSKKKIRHENFPSHISENIAKFAIFKKYKIMPSWDTDKGDIIINKSDLFMQFEIKAFMSSGPSSFGPTENWDWLYFVDATETLHLNFKIYEIKLSNKSQTFRSIRLNKKETYGEIADSGRRPRGCFETIFKKQLGDKCKLIFDGHISELDNTT